MNRVLRIGVLVAVVTGCAEDPLGHVAGGDFRAAVLQGGDGGVYFLPPLLESTYSGTFAPDRDPVVVICEGAPASPCPIPVAEFDMVLDPDESGSRVIRVSVEDEHYIVNWKTAGLPDGEYRIFVVENGTVQAFIDVPVSHGGSRASLGREGLRGFSGTLPVIFRMEETLGGSVGPTTGLLARYYDWRNSEADFGAATFILERVDPVIDFVDPDGTVDVFGIGQTQRFMAVWTGSIVPDATSLYTFCVNYDDGARFWINGVLFFDNWVDQDETMRCSSYWMTAGEAYPVRLEFYHATGGATAQLYWQSLNDAAPYIVPSSALRPE
jgi:hypothetical protein